MLAAIGRWTWRQWIGGALLAIGLGATVALAYFAGASKPPTQAAQVGLAALTILANAGASFVFSGLGRADPTHAQQSVARLVRLADRASGARLVAETNFTSNPTKGDLHAVIGQMSVHLSYLEDGLVEAVEDWRVFHPFAVRQAEDSQNHNNGAGSGNG